MLFVKRRRILVTCCRRLENPAELRLAPSFFLVSEILVMQMRDGGPANPYIRVGETVAQQPGGQGGPAAPLPGDLPPWPAAQLPGGQGGRPPRCRATGPRDLSAIFFLLYFVFKSLPPGCRQRGGRGIFL